MKLGKPVLFLAVILLAGCQHRPWQALGRCRDTLPMGSRQAVVVERDGSGPSGVVIGLYERGDDGWQLQGTTMTAVAGKNGLAPLGEKREGDGRTPSGVVSLERGFGYYPMAIRLPYTVLDPEMIWIDDPRSPLYNRLAERKDGAGFSFEIMRREDELYRYGIVIEYNTKTTVPGAGSAIFFHVWRGPGTTTAGCVAMEQKDMALLLTWLDPARQPVAVIGDACR
jgi:L,D-peptidoglycan transpeptidase YkuD (ErfK/YbiS/YcfS/YnhG family)